VNTYSRHSITRAGLSADGWAPPPGLGCPGRRSSQECSDSGSQENPCRRALKARMDVAIEARAITNACRPQALAFRVTRS
jgi:hypothetical protein